MKSPQEFLSSVHIISYLSVWVEFWTRFILVNIPSALLVNFPELDRISSFAFTYLSLQVVGYCWAFLVNAAFAISCQVASFLPFNQTNEKATTLQLIVSFYFAYASARVVISYAHHASYLGYQSLQDFPHIVTMSKQLSDSLILASTSMFIPIVWIELSVLFAPDLCHFSSDWAILICQHTGLHFFTHSYPKLRKIVFFVCMFLVLQLWQGYLYQFPRWDKAIRASKLSKLSSYLFQLSMLLIAGTTILTLGGLFFSLYLPLVYERYLHLLWLPDPETWAWISLLGWTMWLLLFSRFVLLSSIGVSEQQQQQQSQPQQGQQSQPPQQQQQGESFKLQHLVKSLRISQIIIYFLFFLFFSATGGFLEAQLDCTLISIAVPSLIITMYVLVTISLQINISLLYFGIPFCLFFSYLVCSHMTSRIGGHGSILLISFHLFGKLIQYFGGELFFESDYEGEYEPWNDDEKKKKIHNKNIDFTGATSTPPSIISKRRKMKRNHGQSQLMEIKSVDDLQLMGENKHEDGLRKRKKSISYDDLHQINDVLDHENHAKKALADRGLEHSSLVSVSLPSTVRSHWITALCRRTLGFSLHLARSITITDNFFAGIMRIGTAVGVIFTLLFGIISVLSVLQQNLNLFPKLIYFQSEDQSIFINHIISNVTFFKNYTTYGSAARPPYPTPYPTPHELLRGDIPLFNNLKKPKYASCSLRWKSLSVLDFAILSELSYFDNPLVSSHGGTSAEEKPKNTIQHMLDEFFPHLDFLHIQEDHNQDHNQGQDQGHKGEYSGFEGAHPMYLEVKSVKLGLTIVAVRGTDVGRLHDFLEDVKLFAEPVLISLLSCIFPLMRVSSDTTTSTIIQLLHESNSFFGLVNEAEYYQPLVERVRAISSSNLEDKTDVILTGHSLGGGLSRIVAALTHLPSVSFAPPGIALSHRKFSILENKKNNKTNYHQSRKIGGMTDLHDQSMAVITDFDMIPYVDEQVGLIQKIMCDVSNKSHQNACHLLEGTMCHLLEHCGDHMHRFTGCDYSFNFNALVPSLQGLLWQQRWIIFPLLAILTLMVTLAVVPEIV